MAKIRRAIMAKKKPSEWDATIRGLRKKLNEVPLSVAHDVASRSGPGLTSRTKEANAAMRSTYGTAYPIGVDGKQLTLQDTKATIKSIGFEAEGTVVSCRLGTRYAKYLIGKYGILPNGYIPAEWSRYLRQLVRDTKPSDVWAYDSATGALVKK